MPFFWHNTFYLTKHPIVLEAPKSNRQFTRGATTWSTTFVSQQLPFFKGTTPETGAWPFTGNTFSYANMQGTVIFEELFIFLVTKSPCILSISHVLSTAGDWAKLSSLIMNMHAEIPQFRIGMLVFRGRQTGNFRAQASMTLLGNSLQLLGFRSTVQQNSTTEMSPTQHFLRVEQLPAKSTHSPIELNIVIHIG